ANAMAGGCRREVESARTASSGERFKWPCPLPPRDDGLPDARRDFELEWPTIRSRLLGFHLRADVWGREDLGRRQREHGRVRGIHSRRVPGGRPDRPARERPP